MEPTEVREIILRELPRLVEDDPELQRVIVRLSNRYFADKTETDSRFDRLLGELRRDREEQTRKWEEQNRKWEEQNRKWDEQNRKWDENQETIRQMLDSIDALARKHDSTIGALGARWGLSAESAFRNALKGILEKSFAVEVVTVTEHDDQGEVFGRPDQVELDLIIKDGLLLIAEIKSSVSIADMYTFERKVRFYEKRHGRKATRILVISPMVEKRALAVARKLGVEVYSFAEDVPVGQEEP